MRFKSFIVFLFITQFFLSNTLFAADSDGEYSFEFTGEMGSFLPDQIDGVTEILPMIGLSVGLRKQDTAYTLGVASLKSDGVTLLNSSLEMRTEVPFSGFIGLIAVGVDGNILTKPGETESTFYGGGHVGGGILALISHGLYVRMNMKFIFNPGVSMFLGFGLVYRPSEDE